MSIPRINQQNSPLYIPTKTKHVDQKHSYKIERGLIGYGDRIKVSSYSSDDRYQLSSGQFILSIEKSVPFGYWGLEIFLDRLCDYVPFGHWLFGTYSFWDYMKKSVHRLYSHVLKNNWTVDSYTDFVDHRCKTGEKVVNVKQKEKHYRATLAQRLLACGLNVGLFFRGLVNMAGLGLICLPLDLIATPLICYIVKQYKHEIEQAYKPYKVIETDIREEDQLPPALATDLMDKANARYFNPDN